jgi:deoxyribodipyrimidine photo-lyase
VRAAICLLTRDLRLHDQPTLRAALDAAETVLPLFVRDDGILETRYAAPNRLAFLDGCLADLDCSLRSIGGRLEVRRGDVIAETVRVAREVDAEAVFCSLDVSPYAHERERLLGAELDLRLVNAHFVVPPGEVAPAGREGYEVFTPYHRAWRGVEWGDPLGAPRTLTLPKGRRGSEPRDPLSAAAALVPGGEAAGRARMLRWLRESLEGYGEAHDALAADDTSRLSPYLHFGCVSARELAARARDRAGDAFVRQLCWRDFYAQLLAANPRSATEDLRPRGDRWLDDDEAFDAWREGCTGYPLVDAGMRQLAAEGWMHNRARLVTASFLTKDLGIDWRGGARHFFDLLLDGDVAQNVGNWQWVAGTGVDTRPNRIFNPTAQAKRLDPDGAYVRRYVHELADVADPLAPGLLAPGYPQPIVDHAEASRAFRARRGVE